MKNITKRSEDQVAFIPKFSTMTKCYVIDALYVVVIHTTFYCRSSQPLHNIKESFVT